MFQRFTPLVNRIQAGSLRAACLLFLGLAALNGCQESRDGHSASGANAVGADPTQAQPKAYRFEGQTMGTTWHATVLETGLFKSGEPVPASLAFDVITATLARIDGKMSTYKADSEINRFAQSPAGERFAVSQETHFVVAEALRIAKLSAGAYDPTVMPLVNLWGFGPARWKPAAPSESALQNALAQVDWQGIQVLRQDNTSGSAFFLTRNAATLKLDLSSVAKGYGVDAAAVALIASGFHDFYLEVGGEVRTHGSSLRGGAWRTGIDTPESAQQQGERLSGIVATHNHSVATSGDYRNYREIDGQRVSHSIDARSGLPITHTLASVTVLHPSCMTADALATAAMILGPEKGLALLEAEPDAEGFFIVRKANDFSLLQTSGFEDYLK